MSWDEIGRRRYPCPCGRGEYEEISMMDDWNRTKTEHKMLCTTCKPLYVWDSTNVAPRIHPMRERERGWVLRKNKTKKKS